MILDFYLRAFAGPSGLNRILGFRGVCGRGEFAKALAIAFGMSFVVGPLMGVLALLAMGTGLVWLIIPISLLAWIVHMIGLWLALSCIICRCRDAFGKVLKPVAALLGFFFAPFFILAFLGPLLPDGWSDFMQGRSVSHVIIAGLVLSLVTFAPGLLWLGLQDSRSVKELRVPAAD